MLYQEWFSREHMATQQTVYQSAAEGRWDMWVTAGCGTEVPYICGGRWTLYVYNFATGKHGFLDMETDMVYDTPNNI
jgi:hypothetical protein